MYRYKLPNLNASRFRFNHLNILNKSLFEEFRKKHPKYNDITYKTFQDIITKGNCKIWDGIINYRDGVALPERLGSIFIGTCEQPYKLNVNFVMAKETMLKVPHKNLESDSHLAKIFYTNSESIFNFKYKSVWSFQPCRKFKRSVASTYPEKWMMYLRVEKGKHISKLFKKVKKKNHIKEMNSLIPLSYDEFSMD